MNTLAIALIIGLILLLILPAIDAIPTMIFALNPRTMRYAFDDPSVEQERLSRSAELREWIGRLKQLGFSLLGIKSERLPLWGRTYREAALVSRAAETYASIVLHPDGNPASVYFFTPLGNGGMVFTRNHSYGREMESEQVSVKNTVSKDFREIMENHEGRLRIFLEKGNRPLIGSGQQTRIQATAAFYASEYARRSGRFLVSPGVLGFFLSIIIILAVVVWNIFILR